MNWSLTLTELEKSGACTLELFCPHFAPDEPIDPARAIEIVGFQDVLYACRWLAKGHEVDLRMFACWLARQVVHLAGDPIVLTAIETSERFARGLATAEELTAVRDATRAATCAGARSPVRDSAVCAAMAAVWCPARDASLSPVRDATRAVSLSPVRDATRAVSRAAAASAAAAAAMARVRAEAAAGAAAEAATWARAMARVRAEAAAAQIQTFLAMTRGEAPWQIKGDQNVQQ